MMKRRLTIFLRAVIALIGIGVLAFMLWEPHIEGRNAHASLFQIYFDDPFLAYAYIASIPFFVSLYQINTVLRLAGQNRVCSRAAMKALRTIHYCAMSIIGFVAVGEMFIVFGSTDDRAGGVFVGMLISCISIVIAVAAALLRRRLSKCADGTA